ncbi:Gp22 [Mycobacteroides abscessus subsp. bolletii]|nr:phage tail tape measure protein [Mycobacteroides abscessus subsp. bolletii]QSM90829.1 phage tail tape measure protein [Mycobacteroides abscessus subsp. bolletii]SIJ01078.1 Gp22 [Mycobacteroides abscessus subsp. bolletii]SLD36549.1 Gp22 [Mycobacteroides abscessus subsp. bolletii]
MGIPLPVTAVPDERSFKSAGDRAERAMAEAGRNAGKSFSDAISGAGKDAEGVLKKFGDKASDAYDKARDAAGKLRAEQEKLDNLQRSGAGNQKLIAQSEAVEKARRAEARAIRNVKDSLVDYYQEADKHENGRGAAQAIVQGLSDGLGGGKLSSIGSAGAGDVVSGLMSGTGEARVAGVALGAAAGAGVATAIVAAMSGVITAIGDGMASLRIKDLMQTRMGIDDATMHRVGDAAGRAYAAGFGESIQDNLKAIQFGMQGGLIGQDASEADIAKYAERIQTTSQVMDEDPKSVAKGARNLIRTGLVKDYTQALDLLTVAQQKGLNLSEDLLDTAEEYGTAWHGVGLSAQDAFGLMKQMSDAGIRNTDVAADSIKELSINVSDGSKLTKQAFTALGLDAEDMKRRFAEGGPAAREALGAVIQALQDVQDPLDKNNIGLALFKTKWEDAKTAISAADLKTAAGQMGDIAGETDKATNKLNQHTDAWDRLGRTAGGVLTKIEEALAKSPMGYFFTTTLPNSISDWINGPGGQQTGTANPDANRAPAQLNNPALPGSFQPPNTGVNVGNDPTGLGLGNLVNPNPGTPPPPGSPLAPKVNAPAAPGLQHGQQSHMPSADEEKEKAGKFNAPESAWSLQSIPLGKFPGEEGISGPPVSKAQGAPGQVMWGTGGDPYGKAGYGYYQVDQGRVFDAESSRMSAQTSLQNARFHFLEVQAKADASEQEKYNARAQLVQAGRALQSAEAKLAEAQEGTWKKMESTAKGFSSGMDQIGAALDKDFGLSKGLPGLAENLTKFLANIAAAPLLGQLSAISQANPSKGGYGAMGILGAQGAFGPQYTGLPAAATYAPQGIGPAALQGAGLNPNLAAMYNLAARGGKYAPASDLENGLADCSGSISDLVEVLQGGKSSPARLFDTTAFATDAGAAKFGFLPGYQPGAFNVGVTPLPGQQGHMAATLPNGMNFESGGGHGPMLGGSAAGALDKQFSKQYYLPVGSGATTVPSPPPPGPSPAPAYAPLPDAALNNPGLTNPTPNPYVGMGGGGGMTGPAQGLRPSGQQYGGVEPASGYGKGGVGITPGGTIDTAIGVAASGLDLLAPGAGQAAQTGMKLANRAIQYGGQVAGIATQGLMDTFLPTGGSELANKSWVTKILGGIAGAAPALPNMAGKATAEKNPQQGNQGQQPGQVNNTTNINVTNQRATEDGTGRDIAAAQMAQNQPPAMR